MQSSGSSLLPQCWCRPANSHLDFLIIVSNRWLKLQVPANMKVSAAAVRWRTALLACFSHHSERLSMSSMRDRLPPANALLVFEAVARHHSFTQAAKELGVTQAAVSRQIRVLEEALGTPVFKRLHRRVELSSAGRDLREAVSIGLGHIARAVGEIQRENNIGQSNTGDIGVSCSVTFASYWLMSRIAKFRAEFADVDIRMVAPAKVRDLAVTGIDLAVCYGRGIWPNVRANHLFDDRILPVASPRYIEKHGPFEDTASLYKATLLHLSKFDRNCGSPGSVGLRPLTP